MFPPKNHGGEYLNLPDLSPRKFFRLINYITGDEGSHQGLLPHDVKNTISINEVRGLIEQLSKPLSDITQLIQDNLRALEKQESFLTMENQTLDELKNKLFMPVVLLKVKELTQPVTVCTDKKCASVVQVRISRRFCFRVVIICSRWVKKPNGITNKDAIILAICQASQKK